MRDFLTDSYARRIKWEGRQFALALLEAQNEVYLATRKKKAQGGDSPTKSSRKSGVMSASQFLSGIGLE